MNTNIYFVYYLGGPWGGTFNDYTGPILLSSYPLTHSYKTRKQSDKNFLSLNQKHMKKYNFCIF